MKPFDMLRNAWHRRPPVPAGFFHSSSLRTRFSLLFLLITLGSAGIVGYAGYDSASKAYRDKATELIAGYTSETAIALDSLKNLVRNDLDFLSGDLSLLRYNYWRDMRDEAKQAEWQAGFAGLARAYLANYKYAHKVQFIDAAGNEMIAVRRNPQTGAIDIVAGDELGREQEADYFTRAAALTKGQYYASRLRPDTERGQIEQPLAQAVHFSTPVIGGNGTRYGVVVISVPADSYFLEVRRANAIDPDRRFFLIDSEGEYLFQPDKDKGLAGTTGQGASFLAGFPGLFEQVKGHEQQLTLSSMGKIMSFRHIHPNAGRHENGFILVGMVNETAAMAELRGFVLTFAAILAAVALAVLFAARYSIGRIMAPLEAVTRQLQRLGRGETMLEEIDYRGRDEIGDMVASSRKLMLGMEALATQADAISQGDFSREAPLLSGQDRLGMAVNNMTAMLREARSGEQRGNWLKDGISQLNGALIGDRSAQQLAEAAIAFAGRYLEAGRGVFYRYLKDEQALELLGSYMFTEREALGNRFKLGEGAVGQAARERKPIVLHAAGDAAPIVTGTLSLPPQHIYTYPLLREGELLGAIELASFERYDDLKLEFIGCAAGVMALFLYSAEQREKIKDVLRVAEESARQAQEQARRVQEANTILEEQQQQLQQQSEELQASNAQMEEQQQQLQQQSEELQASNAEMEEQQQQLRQQALDLETKNRELDRRARELEQASQYKSEFLANMSHELRTPLNSIILLSKMLAANEAGGLSGDDMKRAQIVHQSGEELLRLINDILDLSKIESGKMELNLRSIDSGGLAADFHDLFAATAQEKGLEFRVEDQLRGRFVSDRDKLSQVVRNLLSNAFKFTRQGSVTLRIFNSGRSSLPLAIAVIDTGIGIPEDKQKLVFEAFQQVDGSIAREFGGTGLGLAISQRFAGLLGGNIELKSKLGEGSEFTLLLPMRPDTGAAPVPAAPAEPAPRPVPSASVPVQVHDDRANLKSSDPVILLIDDDPGFGEGLMALNKRLGHKTLVAATGQEGLRMAKTYRPRGILLDLGLPDMDGTEVLRCLKSDRELRRLPVYIVSARDKEDNVLRDGIVGYLQKPASEGQLADAEAEVLARGGSEAGALLLLEGEALTRGRLEEIVGREGLAVTAVRRLDAAVEALRADGGLLAVVDLARGAEGEDGVSVCRALREAAPQAPLLLYSEAALSAEEEAALRQYTDSIIVKAPHAEQRMLQNIERFLQRMAPAEGAPGPAGGPGSKKLEGRRVLVIDDDPRNLFVVTSALEQQGATVTNALNGRKGLESLRRHGADLVFMDIMMPEMDGYETIRQIRADPVLKRIPVVALTAKALMADREKARAAGADDYLSKPVDYDVLINMAKVWCEEKR